MTVLSTKKPSNNTNNKDSPGNQQQQQQQQTTVSTRTRPSRDNEHSNEINSIADSNESNNELSSAIATNNLHTMITTSSPPIFSTNSKRKSHNYQQHQQLSQTINRQTRRRRTSIEGNHSSNSNNSSSNEEDSLENNVTSSSTTTMNHQQISEADPCNSEDEHEPSTTVKYDRNNLNEIEMRFIQNLKEKKGFVIKSVQEDGACLFRAVSDQVFGDEEMHATVRHNCMDYIVKNADFFREYITEDFDRYISRKRRQNCHGNHIEMIALSELYNRPIEVYEYSTEPINVVHGMYKTDNEPIRLSYHCGVHYNSIIDPWRPTAGHGLGLPDLEPGHAQQSLIVTALQQSEESHIERAMLDDKLAATDWEATQDELMQQIARESYLQWLCDTNQQSKDNKITSASNSSATSSHITEENSTTNFLPLKLEERKDCEFALPFHYEGDSSTNSDPIDDDESLMQQVLAMSQIEYVENLTKQQSSTSDQPSSSSDANPL
ncbi:hypothetical protein I4U23_018387 [Adineta vaga]|nr:hypothetical protein I4U23_018387 [Adineta vaga]